MAALRTDLEKKKRKERHKSHKFAKKTVNNTMGKYANKRRHKKVALNYHWKLSNFHSFTTDEICSEIEVIKGVGP